MLFMSKQVSLPKISSILQKIKIDPKWYIPLFAQKPSIVITTFKHKGTRGFVFLGKMIDCEHVIVQLVVLLFFCLLHFNKLYPRSKTKIVEITYAIYQGFPRRQLCKEYVRRKVNNVPGVNLHQNFAFACTPSFSSRVIT